MQRNAIATRLGLASVNPYKFGMVGSTDTHTGLAAVEEENFFGKHSGSEPSPMRAAHASKIAADSTTAA